VDHGDSMGNSGAIAAGDVQWMTAGSGIIHHEMPKGDHAGRMHGFQLWANLPSSLKMTAPRYQDVKSGDIPEVKEDDGTEVRIVCGSFWGKKGPVDGIAAKPIYLDVSVPPGRRRTLPVETTRHAFAYVFAGAGKFCNASGPLAVPKSSMTLHRLSRLTLGRNINGWSTGYRSLSSSNLTVFGSRPPSRCSQRALRIGRDQKLLTFP
jgi:quercetin 2,3-dioxygenase